VVVVRAAAGFDANCRFSPYAAFVFVDGAYAGSLSPHPAWPRTDGALQSAALGARGEIAAVYERYGPDTPLCCPTETVRVVFSADRGPDGPVIVPSPERVRVGPDGAVIAGPAGVGDGAPPAPSAAPPAS
ncbi:MAG: LppP/LprE family lipoprotein, partial [Chloroflexota bacterium]